MYSSGLLAELPTLFFANTTSAYIGVVGWLGVVGNHDSGGLNTRLENGPIYALDTTLSGQVNG